jgi:2-dehydropantoate 2-reductase
MRIVVFGAGGVGGYFGGRWAAAGLDVTFVARGAHLDAMRSRGLTLHSPLGDSVVRVAAAERATDAGKADLVVLAIKAWQLPEALATIRPLLGSATRVLGLQNGVEAVATIGGAVGTHRVLGGTCRIIAFIDSPGVIRHAAGAPLVILGEPGGGVSESGSAIARELAHGQGMEVQLSERIEVDIWRKMHWFAAVAGVGSVTGVAAGAFRSVPETRAMLVSAMNEAMEVAAAQGIQLPADATEKAMAFVDGLPADATSTMMRDFRDGKRTELEALSGALVRLGASLGVPTPVHRCIYASLLPRHNEAERASSGERASG